ncbi:unnamed protein product [Blepharisma stoltei]|uniref:UBZ4-type domain-containing protein n=1 Tax=Blepharisma stoltei TaxID=1481888 RepID=A0AAU9J6L3_9CILI|nr:unnamed protein product [Blepharisma stoltei]
MQEVLKEIRHLVTFTHPNLMTFNKSINVPAISRQEIYNEPAKAPMPAIQPKPIKKSGVAVTFPDPKPAKLEKRKEHKPKPKPKSPIDEPMPVFPVKRQRAEILTIDESPKEIKKCPLCEWRFPKDFSEVEMNKHVNACVDGNGVEDIKEYHDSMRAIKKLKKRDERQETQEIASPAIPEIKRPIIEIPTIRKTNDSDSSDDEKNKIQNCPYCKLFIGKRSNDFIEWHIKECAEDKFDMYEEDKKLYDELGNIPKMSKSDIMAKSEYTSLRMFKRKIRKNFN